MTTAAGVRRAGRIGAKTLSWLLLIACLACLAGAIWWVREGRTQDGADILGYRPYLVATGSMAPGYEVHSFVLTHDRDFADVREGDVVAFRAAGLGGAPALHRVIDITRDQAGEPVSFTVKGDNNPHPDGTPVTRADYLGTAVLHTNASAFVWDQAHGPHGMLRMVVLPVALVVLVWIAAHYLLAGRRSLLGRGLVVVSIAFCLLASATASYALYLDKKQDYISTTLGSYATTFERQTPERTMTVEGTSVNGTIDIPRIGVHYPIIEYVAASSLDIAITHFEGPGLNQPGNVVLAGHHAWGNLYFTRIDRLEKGDVIWITDSARRRVRYLVTGHREVTPDDTSVLRQPRDGRRHLTLISCTYDLRNRYVLTAVAAPEPGHVTRSSTAPLVVAEQGIWPEEALPVAVVLGTLGAAGFGVWLVVTTKRRHDERSSS